MIQENEPPKKESSLRIGMILKGKFPHYFQNKPRGHSEGKEENSHYYVDTLRCSGDMIVTELIGPSSAKIVCTTPGCGVKSQVHN